MDFTLLMLRHDIYVTNEIKYISHIDRKAFFSKKNVIDGIHRILIILIIFSYIFKKGRKKYCGIWRNSLSITGRQFFFFHHILWSTKKRSSIHICYMIHFFMVIENGDGTCVPILSRQTVIRCILSITTVKMSVYPSLLDRLSLDVSYNYQ